MFVYGPQGEYSETESESESEDDPEKMLMVNVSSCNFTIIKFFI